MKKKLAIICADVAHVSLVNKAKEMGIETHCFAWKKEKKYYVCEGIADYFHPISILEKEQILEICKEIKIDGIISKQNLHAVPTVCYIAEKMGLNGNRYEDTFIAGNKYSARQAFLKNGANSPRFVVVQKGQIPDLTGFRYPLIIKPTDGGNRQGVMKVDTENELQEALSRAQQSSFTGQVIIEEFITGSEVLVDSISYNGKHFISAIKDKVMSGAPYFMDMGYNMPSQLSQSTIAKIEVELGKSLDALHFKYGESHSDLMISDDGEVYVIEVNSCSNNDESYDMIQYSTGIDFLKMAIKLALGYWEDPVIVPRYYSGVYYLCEGNEWVKQVIENKDHDPDIVDAVLYDEEFLGRRGHFIYKSDRKRTWGI